MQWKVSLSSSFICDVYSLWAILNAFKGQNDQQAKDTPWPPQGKLNKNQVHVRSEPMLQEGINLNVSLKPLHNFTHLDLLLNDVCVF